MGASDSQQMQVNRTTRVARGNNGQVMTFQATSFKVSPPAVPMSNANYPTNTPTNYQMHKMVINDDVLERFCSVQSQIREHNADGVFEGLKKVESDFERLLKEKKQADVNYRVLREQSNKEKQDYDNITSSTVQAYFRSKQDHERAIAKEKQEYMDSVAQVESAEKQLAKVTNNYKSSLEKYNEYQRKNKIAIDLFNEQMDILYSTYEGEEGSALENELEAQCKELEEQKEILKSALNKWSNSRFLLVYAFNQLQCSEVRWSDLMKMDINNPEKVIPATEVRNNLIAAYQNLVNTRSYLKNVTFPYCTDDDLKTLQSLSAGSYQDMLSVERQRYCLNIIQELRKRCYKLNQWFDQVIKSTLVVDYSKVLEELGIRTKELKDERINLLKIKIKEKTGKDVDVNLFNVVPAKDLTEGDTVLEKVNSDANKINQEIGDNKDADKKSNANDDDAASNKNVKREETMDLPPPPSKDQILGDIEQIKAQYREQTEGWNKHLDDSRREADERLQKMLAQHSNK